MNDFIRPALYESFHRIWPVAISTGMQSAPDDVETVRGIAHPLPRDRGAWIAILSAANGMVMAANDKTCPRVAEILVDRSHAHAQLVRRRETYEDLRRPRVGIVSVVKAGRAGQVRRHVGS